MLKIIFYTGIVRVPRGLRTCIVVSRPANRMLLITVNAAVLFKCVFNDFETIFFWLHYRLYVTLRRHANNAW